MKTFKKRDLRGLKGRGEASVLIFENPIMDILFSLKYFKIKVLSIEIFLTKEKYFSDFGIILRCQTLFLEFFFDLEVFFLGTAIKTLNKNLIMIKSPQVGLEPTTNRLTADRSTN